MTPFDFKRTAPAVGMAIHNGELRTGVFTRNGTGWCLERCHGEPLPGNVLRPAFHRKNILDEAGFVQAVKHSLAACGGRTGSVYLSLPDETVKLVVQPLQEMPDDRQACAELIQWTVGRNRSVPMAEISVSWQEMGMDSQGRHVLLVAMAGRRVLAQYHELMQPAGASALGLSPVALNRFNCYAPALPGQGNWLYFCLSRRFVTLAGFTEGVPLFFKTVKRGFLREDTRQAGHDIPLVVDHCLATCPEIKFSRVFVACHGLTCSHAGALFPSQDISTATPLDGTGLITGVSRGAGLTGSDDLGRFSAAAGAVAGGRP